MSWPNFLTPLWGFMGLLAVPLILLYILRQKRPDMPVSSTLLWSKTLADMRASTPFQKLRRNLLLLLQLLILAALVFTLMRPVIQAKAQQTKAGVIVIDATASMQTTDNGGPSRLDRAKQEAKKLVDTMRPGDKFKLIVDGGGLNHFGNDFSSSKSELKGLIDSIKPSDTPSDLSESLILAAESLRAINAQKPGGGAQPKTDAVVAGQVSLFSDGAGIKVPDVMGADAGLLKFYKIGESDHSFGITQLSITPVPKEPRTYQVFVGIKNAWSIPKRVGVLLAFGEKDKYLPGQAQAVDIPAGGQGSVVFEKVVSDPGKLFVRIDDTDDDFPLDNIAYGIIEPQRKPRVTLVTSGNELLERFLKTAVRVDQADGMILSPAQYTPAVESDLVIFDGFVPPAAQMPKVDALLIRPVIKGPGDIGGFKITQEISYPAIIKWKREDPLMQYIELGELRITHALFVERDPDLIELVSANESPLIAYKDFGSARRYLVAFSPLLESNWWQQNSLLLFLEHVIEQTRVRHYIGMPQLVSTGSPARLWNVGDNAGAGDVTITLPDGSAESVIAKEGAADFEKTDKVGFYQVSSGGKKSLFAANLLSPVESDIRPRSLQTVAGSNVDEAAGVASVNKEIWQWLAMAALLVLLVEWWVYHRRIA